MPGSLPMTESPGTGGPQDLPVQLARRFLRLDGELPLEDVATHTWVLLQRRRPTALPQEQGHKVAVDRLLERIHGQEPAARSG